VSLSNDAPTPSHLVEAPHARHSNLETFRSEQLTFHLHVAAVAAKASA
jgi:hypothetical protein